MFLKSTGYSDAKAGSEGLAVNLWSSENIFYCFCYMLLNNRDTF